MDLDGSSKLEKTAGERGTVTVVSEGITFSEKALTSSAKFVVHRNQWKKKRQAKEEDFVDEGEEEGEPQMEGRVPSRHSLGDYLAEEVRF